MQTELIESAATPHSALRTPRFVPFSLLLPYQRRWAEDPARFKIGVWSRQTGKSFSTAAECVADCVRDPGTTWICLSAGERQALEWLEKAKFWNTAFQASVEGIIDIRDSAEALMKSTEVRFANGSRIIALPANPSTARGYSANIVLDEFAYHENPDGIWAAVYPSQTNPLAGTLPERLQAAVQGRGFNHIQRHLKLRVVSTFNGQNNKFFHLWERRNENGYSGHLIDIHQACAEIRQTGIEVNIDELRAGLDDPEAWAQEYECIPADVSAVLLPYELLATCESPEATTTIGPDFFASTRDQRPYVIGIDFGRKHDLTVAWTDEIMGDVLHCREVLELRAMPTPDQVNLLRPRIRNARRVCLDYNGNGVGLGDYLVKEFGQYNPDKHQYGKIELCHITNPLKVELFSKLRMSFEQRRCRIPINRAVREDLHSVQRVTTQNGHITYRAPHTADGRPLYRQGPRPTSRRLCSRTGCLLPRGSHSDYRAPLQHFRHGLSQAVLETHLHWRRDSKPVGKGPLAGRRRLGVSDMTTSAHLPFVPPRPLSRRSAAKTDRPRWMLDVGCSMLDIFGLRTIFTRRPATLSPLPI